MKKSDLATVILIAGLATIATFIVANLLFGDPSGDVVKVQYMDVISSDLTTPSDELFNPTAINPTVEVYVGHCGADQEYDPDTNQCVSTLPETTCAEGDPTCQTPDDQTDEDTDQTDTDDSTTPEE